MAVVAVAVEVVTVGGRRRAATLDRCAVGWRAGTVQVGRRKLWSRRWIGRSWPSAVGAATGRTRGGLW